MLKGLAIEKKLNVVKEYKLIERWVTSGMNNTEEEYVITKEIRKVSLCMFSLLINAMRNF